MVLLKHSTQTALDRSFPFRVSTDCLPKQVFYIQFEVEACSSGGQYKLFKKRVTHAASCDALLTVKHIPLDCPDLQDIRQKYLSASSLKDIFESVDNQNVIRFIKDAHFYHQL